MASYPKICSYNHPALSIGSESELQTHISSAHPNDSAVTIKTALTDPAGSSKQVPQATPSTPFGKWGITAQAVSTLSGRRQARGGDYDRQTVQAFLTDFGSHLSTAITPNYAIFFASFLCLVLHTAASEEVDKAGSFEFSDGSEDVPVAWADFKSAAVKWFTQRHLTFTFRKLMRSCEEVMEALYFDDSTSYFDDIKANGTQISRRWFYPDGSPTEAWVAVPELWTKRLNASQREMRRVISAGVTKKSGTDGIHEYLGFDDNGDVMSRVAMQEESRADVAGHKAVRRLRAAGTVHPNESASSVGARSRLGIP